MTKTNGSPRCPDCGRNVEILLDGTINWHWPLRGAEPCTTSGRPYTPPTPDDEPDDEAPVR